MGVAGVDTRYASNAVKAASVLPFGAYHLLRPEHGGAAQAEHFLKVVLAGPKPTLRYKGEPVSYAVDVELLGDNLADTLRDFVLAVQQATGELPAVYTRASFFNQLGSQHDALFAQCLLWCAHYGVETPTLPRCWDTYFMHQYTSEGVVSGIVGDVDLNRVMGEAPPAKFTLYTPFQHYVVTSRFNDPRNYSYAPHRKQLHEGEDSVDGADAGDPLVFCGHAGTVTKVDYDARGYGHYCIVDFGDGWAAWYAHFESISVSVGQRVNAKEPLGVIGRTGSATGEHCHLTVTNEAIGLDNYVVRKVVNPADYLVQW